ncbi:acyl-CoA dehydrogenase family protein [Pseudonocardia sp.]|uniref:acyl-CoA dehydrogenase family protein n=1 Tax=Pseudonocardia sp. TaxID=60912 RepID=UPI0031FE1F2D
MTATTTLPGLGGILEWFAGEAAAVDQGRSDARAGLRRLGAADLLAPAGGGLPHAVSLVERIAGECMSSAFSLWAHRMVIEYVTRGEPDPGALGDGLRAGHLVGSTAMAPALRDLAGLEPVPVVATRTAGGMRLDGPIRWASNLFDGATVVLPVRLGAAGPGRAVVRIRTTDPGVRVATRPDLLALNGTASSSVQLDGVQVAADAVLSEDLHAFVGAIRPTFLLVQTAFCSGLALRSAREAQERATGPNIELAGDAVAVTARAAGVHERLHAAAADPAVLRPADLLRLRLDAAGVATDATRVEATVRGGAGYVARSDVSRRLREGAFLPIQSPTEGHLRWELSRCT